jgi:hypothetical protein
MSRGVLYMVWGEKAERVLQRSIASLRETNPELPHHVVRLPADTDVYTGLLEKSRMAELTPYEETLFLDADTVVLDRLDFGFAQARRYGLACCICECPWARRYRGMPKDDGVEYNTGVLFFTRAAQDLFRRWHQLVAEVDSAIEFFANGKPVLMPANDQAAFAKAVDGWDRLPFILPLNWNFRAEWYTGFFGPLKVWHDYNDPPGALRELSRYYQGPGAVMQWHSLQRHPG